MCAEPHAQRKNKCKNKKALNPLHAPTKEDNASGGRVAHDAVLGIVCIPSPKDVPCAMSLSIPGARAAS
jgi:hypothetical protein